MNEQSVAASSPFLSRFWKYGLWICFCIIVIYHFICSLNVISPFDQGVADGPFQLYNWMRRIDAGQVPGRDFNCFHGMGIPYLYYPVYRLFGGDILASEFSRQIITRLLTLSTYLIISRICTKSYTLGIIWSLTTIIPTEDWGTGKFQMLSRFLATNVLFAHAPGTSMYGLRGLLPLIFISTCFLSFNWKVLLWQIALLSGSFFFGIENGMALWLGVFCSILLLLVCSYFNSSLLVVAKHLGMVFTGGIALSFFIVLALLGFDGLPKFLSFHFQYQVQDQTWFFGAPPNYFLLDGLRSTLLMTIYLGFLVLAGGTYVLWLCRKIAREASAEKLKYYVAQIVGFNFGIISLATMLGYMSVGGVTSFSRVVCLFVSVALYSRLSSVTFTKKAELLGRYGLGTMVGLAIVHCVYQTSLLGGIGYSERFERFRKVGAPIYADHAKLSQPDLLWSTFTGFYEGELDVPAPTEWDYIFHALGPDRQVYLKKFGEYQPKYVTSMRNDVNQWEEWVRTSMYPFYRNLLFHYKIIGETPFTFVWQRADDGNEVATAAAPVELVPIAPLEYVVPAVSKDENLALLVIDVEYETQNPIRWLPLLGNSARYLIHIIGSKAGYDISLSPFLTKHTFPVIPIPGQDFRMQFHIKGIRWGASIDVKKVTATKITLDPANKLFLKPSPDYKGAE